MSSDAEKERRRAGIGMVACPAAALVLVLFAPWKPRADFDVTGILWLMQNILPFTILAILCAGATGAFSVWLRCVSGHRQRLKSRFENKAKRND